jgi:hypothetical protein
MVLGLVLSHGFAVAALAQLPGPVSPPPRAQSGPGGSQTPQAQLKDELAQLLNDRNRFAAADDTSNERARLQGELNELLKRITASARTKPEPPKNPPPPKISPVTTLPDGRPVNAVREGMNYFRENEFEIALGVFKRIDTTVMLREDRAYVQYMTACSLRRLNRPNDAAVIYREIADSRDDEFIAECAIWQLSMIRESQDLETQLDVLRTRSKVR